MKENNKKRTIIINADDFGLSKGINKGIIEAYKNGILTSTSICANGECFDDAVKLAKENNISTLDNSCLVKPKTIPVDLQSLINDIKNLREKNGGELTQFKIDLNNKFALNTQPKCEYEQMVKGKGADVILKKGNKEFLVYIGDTLEGSFELVEVNMNDALFRNGQKMYRIKKHKDK